MNKPTLPTDNERKHTMSEDTTKAAKALGRKGGQARAQSTTSAQRVEWSRKAGLASARKRAEKKHTTQQAEKETNDDTTGNN